VSAKYTAEKDCRGHTADKAYGKGIIGEPANFELGGKNAEHRHNNGRHKHYANGSKTLEQAVTLEDVQNAADSGDAPPLLLPVDAYFSTYPVLTVEGSAEKKLRNGMTLVMPQLLPGKYRVYGAENAFLALCQADGGKLTTIKSFFEV
jgi:hypothetical protein